MNISKSVGYALVNSGLTKKQLAEKLGTSQNTVSKLCKEKTCSGKMLDQLCAAFEMKVSDFVALGE
jgi:DNA-binding Xre family transcriptional regulator